MEYFTLILLTIPKANNFTNRNGLSSRIKNSGFSYSIKDYEGGGAIFKEIIVPDD